MSVAPHIWNLSAILVAHPPLDDARRRGFLLMGRGKKENRDSSPSAALRASAGGIGYPDALRMIQGQECGAEFKVARCISRATHRRLPRAEFGPSPSILSLTGRGEDQSQDSSRSMS